jgi:5-methylcytosine-specific restriction protein A
MTSRPRACIICGKPAKGTRCAKHSPKRTPWQRSDNRPRLGWAWQQRRKQVLAEEKQCRYCGRTTDLEVDHIVPRAEGGSDDRANLQVLCHRCHKMKTQGESKRGMRRANH